MPQPERGVGQRAFARALLDPAAPVPDDFRSPDGVAQGGADPVARRFAIYRNNVTTALVDALAATFPACQSLVGEAFFRAMARAHVREDPPASPVLIDYGGGFPAFISGFPPAASVPYLGDVARLEWACSRAYNAADADAVGVDALAALPPEAMAGATLIAHPAVQILRSAFPVATIRGDTLGHVAAGRIDLGRAETILVRRPDLDIDVNVIGDDTADATEAMLAGLPLGAIAERLARDHPQADFGQQLATLFRAGLVAGIRDKDIP